MPPGFRGILPGKSALCLILVRTLLTFQFTEFVNHLGGVGTPVESLGVPMLGM